MWKAENLNSKFKILAESQKVTHSNRVNHYIMVVEVKDTKINKRGCTETPCGDHCSCQKFKKGNNYRQP